MRVFLPMLLGVLLATLAGAAAQDYPNYLPRAEQEAWAERLAEAKARIDRAEVRRQKAENALGEARHEHYPRGEDLAQIEQEFADAKRELEEARQDFDRLLEEARRAGVLPEVLRPYR